MMGENVARVAGGGYVSVKYADIIDPKPEETRTPDQIIDGLRAKIKQ
jgi:hypothetical protein